MFPGAFIGQDSECISIHLSAMVNLIAGLLGKAGFLFIFSPFLSKFIYVILFVDAYRYKIIN